MKIMKVKVLIKFSSATELKEPILRAIIELLLTEFARETSTSMGSSSFYQKVS
jgi:hypothetical protein